MHKEKIILILMNKTICLNMIVKNEAHIIEGTLENLCSKIKFAYWVVCDTGSTDGTQDIIKQFFKDKNIDGELHETEWKDFAYNRTDALNKAYNKTDYVLIFDADDKIWGNLSLSNLTADKYNLIFGKDFTYKRPLLVSNRIKSKFVGVLHEYFEFIDYNNIKEGTIEGDYYVESGRVGARSKDPEKYYKDALVLEKAHDIAVIENDTIKSRYAFYCAQSYKDCNKLTEAVKWYKQRVEYGGWNQEVYYSYIQLGSLYMMMGEKEKAIYYYTLSHDADPERNEGIYEVIKYFREQNKYMLAYKYFLIANKNKVDLNSKLFITQDVYQYKLDFEYSIIASYTNCHVDALISYKKLFQCTLNNMIQPDVAFLILSNFRFFYKYCNPKDIEFYKLFMSFVRKINEIKKLSKEDVEIVNEMTLMYKQTTPIQPIINNSINKSDSNMIKVINLKHREDRKKQIETLFNANNITNYEFFEAVCGKELIMDNFIDLFIGNLYNYKKGIIGCTMSHILLWIKLLQDDLPYYIILEDDIEFSFLYNNRMNDIKEFGNLVEKNKDTIDMLFLGHHIIIDELYKKNFVYDNLINVVNKNDYYGGTFSYIITKNGAKKLLEYILKNNAIHAVDTVIINCDNINILTCNPHFILSDYMLPNNNNDTDVQNNTDGFNYHEYLLKGDIKSYNDSMVYLKSTFPETFEFFEKRNRFVKLRELTKYYREKNNQTKAYEYYLLAKAAIFDSLSESDIKLLNYEYTIICYYIQNPDGLKACIDYLNNPAPTYNIMDDSVYGNIDFYLERLADNGNIIDIPFKDIDNYTPSSCSIVKHMDDIIISSRYVNYRIIKGDYICMNKDNIIRTQNMLHSMKDDNIIVNTMAEENFIDYSNMKLPIVQSFQRGLEDVRLFSYNNILYYIATSTEYSTKGNYNMVMGKIINNMYTDNVIIESPNNSFHEKNWIPITNNNKLQFIYHWYPLQIGEIEYNKLKITTTYKTPTFFKHYRGSTGFVEYNNMLWCIVHTAKYYTPRKYFHQFVVLDKDTYKPLYYSLPFYFNKYMIEYTLGFIIQDNIASIIFSQNDSNPSLLKISMDKVKIIEM